MKVKSLILVFFLFVGTVSAQNKVALKYASCLDSTRMKKTLTKLCSDEFEGRKATLRGGDLACEYLIKQLKQFKLKGGNKGLFKQNIEAFYQKRANKYFYLNGFNYKRNYCYNNTSQQDFVITGEDIVFVGYGVHDASYNDFEGIDITGKIVMVLKGDGPKNKYGASYNDTGRIPDFDYIRSKNPKAIFVVKKGFERLSCYSYSSFTYSSYEEKNRLKKVEINEVLANRILEPVNKSVKQLEYELECSGTSKSFEFKRKLSFNGDKAYKLSKLSNVAAVIKGSDLKDEYVILCAHYNGYGKGYYKRICPSADDNASGVSAVMEIARVLQKAKIAGKGPRRSVVILFPTADERQMNGSQYYVDKPLYPLNKTIACVNINMLGRMGDYVKSKYIKTGYIYALTDTEYHNDKLFNIPDSINRVSTRLSVLPSVSCSYSPEFRSSDNYTFYRKDIPSMLFTNGSHSDTHSSSDTVDKINFSAMLERSKLIFLTVWDLANNSKPFSVKKIKEKTEE